MGHWNNKKQILHAQNADTAQITAAMATSVALPSSLPSHNDSSFDESPSFYYFVQIFVAMSDDEAAEREMKALLLKSRDNETATLKARRDAERATAKAARAAEKAAAAAALAVAEQRKKVRKIAAERRAR